MSDFRILLVGVGGQLGQELRRTLANLGEIIAPRRDELDLASAEQIGHVVRGTRPHLVVNAAAYTSVDRAEHERQTAITINGTAPGILAEEAGLCGAVIVHYSTDYVFDGSGTRPWSEDDPTVPLNVYGESKLAGERAVASSGTPHLILRTSWLYGRREPNFVATMLRLGATNRELAIVDDQIGAPTAARALADATARILSHSRRPAPEVIRESGGLYHACCGGETSWCGFAREIFRVAPQVGHALVLREVRPIASSDYPTAARRPLNSRLDCTRLERQFSIRLPDWREALTDFLRERRGPAEKGNRIR